MNYLSGDQKIAAAHWLSENGWKFDVDWTDPRTTFDNLRGWWINPNHPTKCRRTGDGRLFFEAAETTFKLYTDATVYDLPYLDHYRNEWVWPVAA